jgi:hypothetical protein
MYHDVTDLDDYELEKEILFAEKSLDGTTTTIGWLLHLVTEKERRANAG